MKAAIISLGSTSSKWIAEAMSKYFDEVDDIDIRDIEVNLGKIKQNAPTLCVRYEGEIIPLNTPYMRPISMKEENAIG